MDITQEELKELLRYDGKTGKFYHIRIRKGVSDLSKEAGCGEQFTSPSPQIYCSVDCRDMACRMRERPTKEVLGSLLRDTSFSSVGRVFGVSDNAIRKWCKHYQMSTKSKDYK